MTLLPLQRRGHALEGVSRHGRAAPVCRPPARGREDGAAVRRVRDLPEDGLQDLRPLQGLRGPGVQRPQPAAASAGESVAGADRGHDRAPEARVSGLGRAEDPREAAAAVPGPASAGHQHGPRRARSSRPGAPSAPAAAARAGTALSDRPSRTRSGVPTTKASSCWAIDGTAIR